MAQTLTPEHVKFLIEHGLRRVLRWDDEAEHQVRLSIQHRTQHIAVSCSCRPNPNGGWEPLEARPSWQPGEAIARWRQHVAEAEAAS